MGALEKNQYMKCINAWGGKVKREFDFIIGRTKEVITSILYIVHIWRGTPGDAADVPATKLPSTYRILTLSFPL